MSPTILYLVTTTSSAIVDSSSSPESFPLSAMIPFQVFTQKSSTATQTKWRKPNSCTCFTVPRVPRWPRDTFELQGGEGENILEMAIISGANIKWQMVNLGGRKRSIYSNVLYGNVNLIVSRSVSYIVFIIRRSHSIVSRVLPEMSRMRVNEVLWESFSHYRDSEWTGIRCGRPS